MHENMVNAALTIQLSSHLFHFINMYMFNWCVNARMCVTVDYGGTGSYRSRAMRTYAECGQSVCCHDSHTCTRGRLRPDSNRQLKCILKAFNRHSLCSLQVTCHQSYYPLIYTSTEKSMSDLPSLVARCYRLNSIQVRNLLERYQSEPGEPAVQRQFIESMADVCVLSHERYR
jgi:hypothetical protein